MMQLVIEFLKSRPTYWLSKKSRHSYSSTTHCANFCILHAVPTHFFSEMAQHFRKHKKYAEDPGKSFPGLCIETLREKN